MERRPALVFSSRRWFRLRSERLEADVRGELVEGLIAVSCGPPELGLVNFYGKVNHVSGPGWRLDVLRDDGGGHFG